MAARMMPRNPTPDILAGVRTQTPDDASLFAMFGHVDDEGRQDIPVDLIDDNPWQPRQDYDGIDEIDGDKMIIWYPKPERLVINVAQYARPDSRDTRIAELERRIESALAYCGGKMHPTDKVFMIYTTLMEDEMTEAQPSATAYEEMAI